MLSQAKTEAALVWQYWISVALSATPSPTRTRGKICVRIALFGCLISHTQKDDRSELHGASNAVT